MEVLFKSSGFILSHPESWTISRHKCREEDFIGVSLLTWEINTTGRSDESDDFLKFPQAGKRSYVSETLCTRLTTTLEYTEKGVKGINMQEFAAILREVTSNECSLPSLSLSVHNANLWNSLATRVLQSTDTIWTSWLKSTMQSSHEWQVIAINQETNWVQFGKIILNSPRVFSFILWRQSIR